MCLYNEICDNADEMFTLEQDEDFTCQFSVEGFSRLRGLITEPFEEPFDAVHCTGAYTGYTNRPGGTREYLDGTFESGEEKGSFCSNKAYDRALTV